MTKQEIYLYLIISENTKNAIIQEIYNGTKSTYEVSTGENRFIISKKSDEDDKNIVYAVHVQSSSVFILDLNTLKLWLANTGGVLDDYAIKKLIDIKLIYISEKKLSLQEVYNVYITKNL